MLFVCHLHLPYVLWCGCDAAAARNEQKKPFKYVVSCTSALVKKHENAVLSIFSWTKNMKGNDGGGDNCEQIL